MPGTTDHDARELEALRGQLRATAALVEELQHELAATRDDRDRFEGAARDLSATVERLQRETEELRARLREVEHDLASRDADLRVVQESETYRLARALSWPVRAVKGRRR